MTDFVLTLPLRTEKWQEDILEKRLNYHQLAINLIYHQLMIITSWSRKYNHCIYKLN